MLEQFHMLTLQSKITAYDYYTTLTKLTDNTGVGKTYVSSSFLNFNMLITVATGPNQAFYADGTPVASPEDA